MRWQWGNSRAGESVSRATWTPRKLSRAAGILAAEIKRWREPVVGRVRTETHDPFRILISCVISLRTKDAVTGAASERLFRLAKTPRAMLALSARRIARAIYPAGFYRVKSRQIRQISRAILKDHRGRVPSDEEALLKFDGVGRKTANLVLGLGFGKPAICVDIHVHRISNRFGLVRTRTPEETELSLKKVLPRRYWISWNDWLVPYGQHICQPVSPWCSRCRLRPLCPRRGVVHSR